MAHTLFDGPGPGHISIREYKLAYPPRAFRTAFKFAFVRNPWDRLLSAYHYLKRGGMNQSDKAFYDNEISCYSDFNHFVEEWINNTNIHRYHHFIPQTHYIIEEGCSHSFCDYVGRFESIETDFNYIASRLGVNKTLAKKNTSPKKLDYRNHYTETSRRRVAEVYKRDIEYLGYEY